MRRRDQYFSDHNLSQLSNPGPTDEKPTALKSQIEME